MTEINITYSTKAKKFIQKNPKRMSREKVRELIRKSIARLEGDRSINIDLKFLKGRSKGKYRIRSGDIRIIFYFERGEVYVVTVEDIGFRGDAYNMRERESDYQT